MDFKYRIVNNEVIITGYSDLSSTEINIPEFIDGLPVTCIDEHAFHGVLHVEYLILPNSIVDIHWNIFSYDHKISYINDNKVSGYIHVINNRYIYYRGGINYIIYQIGGEYYCSVGDNKRYFINGLRYWVDFNKGFIW